MVDLFKCNQIVQTKSQSKVHQFELLTRANFEKKNLCHSNVNEPHTHTLFVPKSPKTHNKTYACVCRLTSSHSLNACISNRKLFFLSFCSFSWNISSFCCYSLCRCRCRCRSLHFVFFRFSLLTEHYVDVYPMCVCVCVCAPVSVSIC